MSHHGEIALTLARAIDALGYDSDEIFASANVDKYELSKPGARLGVTRAHILWRTSVHAIGNDALGVDFVRHFHMAGLQGFWVCCATRKNLLEALRCVVSYFRVIATLGDVAIVESKGEVRITLTLPMPVSVTAHELIDAAIAIFMQVCRFAVDKDITAKRVTLQRPEPIRRDRFEHYFKSPIEFNATENALVFDKAMLQDLLPVADAELTNAYEQLMIHYLNRLNEPHFSSQVTSLVIKALSSGIPTQQDIAEKLFLSSRTLKRRLAEERITFIELLEGAQLELARQYLRETTLTIAEISALIGYSEPSNFTRSFKKWTRLTPKQYREKHT